MKQKLLFIALFIIGLINTAGAQNSIVRVQGHARPDIWQNHSIIRNVPDADTKEENNFTFEDISFWIGEGEKQAALVIDWYDDKDNTLVWGFRWDGTATGFNMISAIAKADPRFLLLTHDTPLGMTIAGLGYDLNKSGGQYLVLDSDMENPYYPVTGIVTTDAYNYDDWKNEDPEDHWQSGWYTGYWSYQIKDSQEAGFSYSDLGCSMRVLQDGSWDAWAYQDGWESSEGVLPRIPYVSAVSPFTMYDSYWSEMGKDSTHMSIIDTKIARHADEISEKWKVQLSSSWISGGQPLIVNENVYLAVNNKIMMIDGETGDVLKENTLAGQCGFFSMIAYGEGKIFVPMGNGVLQAFNAETLESIWKTEVKSGYQQLCPVVYHDGYVYTGMWKGGSTTSGVYYCVSAADEDPHSTEEIKKITWESDDTGFYWSGGTIVGDCIIFGGDSGYLQSRNKKTGELIDSYQIAPELSVSTIRSGISYDKTTGMVYFTGKETQKIYGVKVNQDGTLDKENVVSAEGMGQATTTPTVFNGRLYATSGTMTSSGGMDVLDARTLEHIYSVELGGISQSTPLMTTGYATPENNNTVYLYVCLNNATGSIVCVKDFEGNTEPIVQFTYIPSSTQYCTHSLVADEKGTLYYKNDAKYLFALESNPFIEVTSVSLNNDSISLSPEETFQLQAVINPEDATNQNVIWSGSNDEILSVDENGLITALAKGTATVTVTTEEGEFTAQCIVQVTIPVHSIVLNKSDIELTEEDTFQLEVSINPEDADNKNVSWASSNEDVATVSENGLITAIAEGTAIVTVTTQDGELTATCEVTVIGLVGIEGDKSERNVYIYERQIEFRGYQDAIFGIYSVSGQQVGTIKVTDGKYIYTVATPAGVYILKELNKPNGEVMKVIIK